MSGSCSRNFTRKKTEIHESTAKKKVYLRYILACITNVKI